VYFKFGNLAPMYILLNRDFCTFDWHFVDRIPGLNHPDRLTGKIKFLAIKFPWGKLRECSGTERGKEDEMVKFRIIKKILSLIGVKIFCWKIALQGLATQKKLKN